jgi:hypothetical protein
VGQTDFVGSIGCGAAWYGNEEVEDVLPVLAITVTVHNTFCFCVVFILGAFGCAATRIALYFYTSVLFSRKKLTFL